MTQWEKSKKNSESHLHLTGVLKRALPLCEELNQLLRYLCTQGNNEEIYKSIFANIFELELKDSSAYVVTENRQDKAKEEEPSKDRPSTEFQLKAGKGGIRRSDIYIVDKKGSEDKNLHVIEFKSNRHGYFFFVDKNSREKPFPDNIRETNYKDILDDVEVLHSQKLTYLGATFWICVVLYSFDCEKEKYPDKYPRYWWKDESKQDLRKRRPFDESAFNEDCELKRESFIVNLSHLINKSPYRCNVESERVFQSEVVKGDHRGVYVRSDIVLLEVNFK